MMEEDQEEGYICKFCNKSFFSGKSLGGHMRGHLALISAKKIEKNNNSNTGLERFRENPKKILRISGPSDRILGQLKVKSPIHMGFEDDGESSYGLRENPKKSWRVSDSKHSDLGKENICKECGKEFHSMRALSGHMRSHSLKKREENVCKKCGKGFDSMRALFGHMRSHPKRSRVSNESIESKLDNNTACPIRGKRSRTRYKINPNHSYSDWNSSSSIAETIEVEEVAMCLLMLFRGVRNWGEFNLVKDSSNNNSVNFEAQSSHGSKGIAENGDSYEMWKMKKPREKINCVSGSANALVEKNISEFGENKIELGFSVDELKKVRLDDESQNELDDTYIEMGINPTELKLGKDEITEARLNQADLGLIKSNSSKNAMFDGHDFDFGGNSGDRINYATTDSEILKESERKHKYKCMTCDKIFHSYQALGGHRSSHKTVDSCFALKLESCEKRIQTKSLSDFEANSELGKLECSENSLEQEIGGAVVTSYELEKSKDHECSICFRVFASGQALGGHKRAHYIGFTESRPNETTLLNQELPDIQNIFDLNLPATMREGDNGNAVFKPWWVGSDHEYEPLAIFN